MILYIVHSLFFSGYTYIRTPFQYPCILSIVPGQDWPCPLLTEASQKRDVKTLECPTYQGGVTHSLGTSPVAHLKAFQFFLCFFLESKVIMETLWWKSMQFLMIVCWLFVSLESPAGKRGEGREVRERFFYACTCPFNITLRN